VSAPRVLLVEPDVLTRTGLRVALLDAGFEVAGEVAGAAEALAAAPEADLVLVSTGLAGGLEVVRRISQVLPDVRVVVLTERPSGDELLDAVLAGASGYLAAEGAQDRLPYALRGVLAGEVALPRRHTERLLEELRERRSRRARVEARASARVTDREWEVLELLRAGASSAQIAAQLGISEVTVRRHASSVVGKLGVADRASAVRLVTGRSAR
jgi:DNA-binding NarL/FixJ family response regulator